MKSYKIILFFLLVASQALAQNSVCFQSLRCDATGLYVRVTYNCEVRCVADLQFVYYRIDASGYVGTATPITRYDFPVGQGTKEIFVANTSVCIKLLAFQRDVINPASSSGYRFEIDSRYNVVCTNGKGDQNCCFSPTPITNVSCNLLSVTSTTEPVLCSGRMGSATLTVTGGRLPPYTYAWSNGATTSTISAPADAYSVTVTDASGCTITKDNIIIEDKKLSITVTTQAKVCGAQKGSASVTITGGRGLYLYEWNNRENTRGTTSTFTSITEPPGTYSVQIIDALGCSVFADVVIEDGCACNLLLDKRIDTELGCPNNPMGKYIVVLSAVSSGPTPPYNYKLTSASPNSVFTPQYQNNSNTVTYWTVPPGKYLIEVEDANRCKKSLPFEYIENCPVDCKPHIDNCRAEWQQFLLKNYAGGECKLKIWETDCNTTSTIRRNGKVAIGLNLKTVPDGFNLAVQGGVIANEVKVKLCSFDAWCDYVFDKKYKLMPLLEVNNYIQQNKRLPNMPSTADIVKEGGYEIKKLALLQLEKIEEAYLHLIKLEEKVKDEQTKIDRKKQRNNKIAQLIK